MLRLSGAGLGRMRTSIGALIIIAPLALSACINTSMQGYADRDLPQNTIQRIAAYVAAPGPLAARMQQNIADEAKTRGISAEDAFTILPPTRRYTDAEVRKALAARGVDGVLLITVADSGVRAQYAGTIFQSTYSGSSSVAGSINQLGNTSTVSLNGISSGSTIGSATPTFSYSRRTEFSARLIDPNSARVLWVGNGEVDSGGGKGLISRLIVSDGVSSSKSISAIFEDLQKKGLIGTGGAS
jgi:hypothetical protein